MGKLCWQACGWVHECLPVSSTLLFLCFSDYFFVLFFLKQDLSLWFFCKVTDSSMGTLKQPIHSLPSTCKNTFELTLWSPVGKRYVCWILDLVQHCACYWKGPLSLFCYFPSDLMGKCFSSALGSSRWRSSDITLSFPCWHHSSVAPWPWCVRLQRLSHSCSMHSSSLFLVCVPGTFRKESHGLCGLSWQECCRLGSLP